MPTKSKVVPISEDKPTLVAKDETSRRYILQIGSDRVAFDYTLRVTKLAPNTGDARAGCFRSRRRPTLAPLRIDEAVSRGRCLPLSIASLPPTAQAAGTLSFGAFNQFRQGRQGRRTYLVG